MRPSSDTQRSKRGDTDNHSTINPDDIDASDDLSRPAVQRQMDAPLPRSDIKKRIRGLIGSLRTFSNPLSRKRSAPQLPQSSTSLSLRDTATVPSLPPPHVTESPAPSFPPHNVTESPATPAPIFLPLPISRSRKAFNLGWVHRDGISSQDPNPPRRTKSAPQLSRSLMLSSPSTRARAVTLMAPKRSNRPDSRPPMSGESNE